MLLLLLLPPALRLQPARGQPARATPRGSDGQGVARAWCVGGCVRPGLETHVLVHRGQADSGCASIIGFSKLFRLETSSFVSRCSEAYRASVFATPLAMPPTTTTSCTLAMFFFTVARSLSM